MSEDAIALAKLRLEDLLSYFGLNAKVAVREEAELVELSVAAEPSSNLIGHHGETLRAIQYLINQMVRVRFAERLFFSIDIGGYKKARDEQLARTAQTAAEQVLSTGESQELPVMNAAERRVVHTALGEVTGVTTASVGVDPHRHIVIKPAT